MTKAGNSHKLPSLDGWRAVSIALVLIAHSSYASGFPPMFDAALKGFHANGIEPGGFGVRFFFVISGFLITWLLLQEHAKHGVISLKHFYARRALRILPVYFFYLLALGALTQYSQSPTDWLANATFATDFFGTPFATAHFWTLGVEEQFYLLWPGLLVWMLHRQKSGAGLLKFLLVPLVAVPLVRIIECKHWYPGPLHNLFFYGSFFMRSDSLAYGCVAAVLFTHWRKELERFFESNFRAVACGGGCLIFLVPPALHQAHLPARFQNAGFESLQAIGFSLLLLQSVLYPSRGFYRALNWKWVAHLGVLS